MFINLCFFISLTFAQTRPGGPGQAGSGQNDAAGSMTLDGNLNIRECNSPCCTDFYDDADVAIESDIKYGSAFHLDGTTPYELFLDTYEVKQRNAADPFKNTKKPVAVFVHGGGFSPDSTKDGEQALEACTGWAKRGFVCVSVEYRRWAGVSGATTLRVRNDPALDLQAALRYLVKEADNIGYDSANGFGIDAEQIVLYGGSAGGLTISSALLLDVEKVAAKTHEVDVANWNLGYPSSEFCSRNATSVNCHCQFDPTRMHEDGCNSGNWGGLGIENVKGVIVNSGGIDIPQLDSGIESCMQRPYFGMHYDGDSRVNYNKATTAKSLLDRSNTPNALLTAPGNSHVLRMFEVAGYANSILFDDIYAFCLQQLDTTCTLGDGANVQPCVDVDQEEAMTDSPSTSPSSSPTTSPSSSPTTSPTTSPTASPSSSPTSPKSPVATTDSPTSIPSPSPTVDVASKSPSSSPKARTTASPTLNPSPSPQVQTKNNCPSGYDQIGTMTENNDIGGYGMAGSSPRIINTVDECATICDETEGCLSFTWGWGGNIRAFDANGAGRCIWYNRDTPNRDDGRNVLFCARPMATNAPTVKPTELPTPSSDGADYVLANSIGATACPRGFAYITNMDECNLARKALDGVDGWNDEGLKTHSARMPFCWVGRDKKANYNPSGDWGADFSKSTLICKRYEFALIDGAPGSGRSPAEVSDPDPTQELGEVQCCQRNGVCTRQWPEAFGEKFRCLSGKNDAVKYTLQGAVGICGRLGSDWDLCTRAQTNNNNCKWKGCQHDHELVWVKENTMKVVNPAPERFALIDGAPNGGRQVAEYANPDPTEKLGEVQCCQVDGQCTRRFPWSLDNKSDCLSGNNDASKFTLQEAVDMCKNLGAEWSLCTREQTNNDNCRGTGCQHDSALVWVEDHI